MRFINQEEQSFSHQFLHPNQSPIDFEPLLLIKYSLNNILESQKEQVHKTIEVDFSQKEKDVNRDEYLQTINQSKKQQQQPGFQKSSRLIICNKCNQVFTNSVLRVQHSMWCQKDKRTLKQRQKYLSSYQKYKYQCTKHEIVYYFTNLNQLLDHISTHRQKKQMKQLKILQANNQDKESKKSKKIPIQSLFRQFKSIKKLSSFQIERLSQNKKISANTIRKYYKIFISQQV